MEIAFAFAIRDIAPLFDDGHVGGQKAVSDSAGQVKTGVKSFLIEVIKKQAANAAGCVALLQEEILVAPFMVGGRLVVAEGGHGIVADTVEVDDVFNQGVIRGQVKQEGRAAGRGK